MQKLSTVTLNLGGSVYVCAYNKDHVSILERGQWKSITSDGVKLACGMTVTPQQLRLTIEKKVANLN